MKLGVPWSVKGIRPEARATAREAARRSGMSLGEWLNTVIIQNADDDVDPDEVGNERSAEDIRAVHNRLDDITQRIDRLGRPQGPEAYAPPRYRAPQESDQIAELIARLDHRFEQLARMVQTAPALHPQYLPTAPQLQPVVPQPIPQASALDRAMAEIAARQRALNGAPPASAQSSSIMAPPPPMPSMPAAAPRTALPAQDLSGLEDQLRSITDQIETLRKPGVEEAINALRGELGDIGRALSDAMPRREIETIEQQIQALTNRIAEGRQAGVDQGALGGIEQGLADIRNALGSLTPAESLIGFNDAINSLAHKIDLIVAEKDPAMLHQLETAITTLRDISQHIASNETVGQLASDVAMLADKVDRIANASGAGDALAHLEHRIAALADALAQRSQNGDSVPPRLEALVDSLTDKIERVQSQMSGTDTVAFGHLEDRIVKLVDRLDASDSRLGHLENLERGLADMLVHLEEMRRQNGAGGLRADNAPGGEAVRHDIARTQDALDAMHGTLGLVVDRLAALERGIRDDDRRVQQPAEAQQEPSRRQHDQERQPDTIPLSLGKVGVRAVPVDAPPTMIEPQPVIEPPARYLPARDLPEMLLDMPYAPEPPQHAAPIPAPAAPMPAAVPPPAPRRPPAPTHRHEPIDPNLPPDQPLEPGSGAPRLRGARITAAGGLGDARSQAPASEGKSGFLAAARRAAQLAGKGSNSGTSPEPTSHAALWADAENPIEGQPSLRARISKRVKSLFIAASMIAIVIGGLQIGATYFDFGRNRTQTAKLTGSSVADAGKAFSDRADSTDVAELSEPDTTVPANPLPSATALLAPDLATATAKTPTGTRDLPMTALSSVPMLSGSPALKTEVTGSVRAPARQDQAHAVDDKLPAAVGGSALRSAALAGDPRAAYEVGVRYAEGRGVRANAEEAAQWFGRAAHAGLAPAQFRLGSLYEKGHGVKKNLAEARRLYTAAAAKGNGKAMHNLAVLYAEGGDGKPDYAAAAQWFRKAADRGVADSQYNLAILYARGLGVEKSYTESYKWFALAAAQGDKESAKKRDELAARLDAKSLSAAQRAVKIWVAVPQPDAAVTVSAPAGGWDADAAAPQTRKTASETARKTASAATTGRR